MPRAQAVDVRLRKASQSTWTILKDLRMLAKRAGSDQVYRKPPKTTKAPIDRNRPQAPDRPQQPPNSPNSRLARGFLSTPKNAGPKLPSQGYLLRVAANHLPYCSRERGVADGVPAAAPSGWAIVEDCLCV